MNKTKNILLLLLWCCLLVNESIAQNLPVKSGQAKIVDLSGSWKFRMDPDDVGLSEHWYTQPFTDSLSLPGSMQEQGFGYDIEPDTEWWNGEIGGLWRLNSIYEKYRQPDHVKIYEWLQPEKHYLGAAWYAKKVTIPNNWEDKRIVLVLERVHWKATVFVDDQEVGSSMRLGTAQEFNLTDYLSPGEHRITLRIDNSRIIDLGRSAHSVSEQTQATWNGVIGKLELRARDKVWVKEVQVYPDVKEKQARVTVVLKNSTDMAARGNLRLALQSYNTNHPQIFPEMADAVKVDPGTDSIQLIYKIGDRLQLWNEFHPTLYRLSVSLDTKNRGKDYSDQQEVTFGMREINTEGRQILVNGRPVHLRGNVDCAVFPIHGYPRMDIAWWRNLWLTYQEWGMNHVRFHSWCPPRAAFIAADEVGIYMEPEASEWASVKNPEQMTFIREESEAMLRHYGNHASFVMMSMGNELSADQAFLNELIHEWKNDKRRIYSGKINGRPVLESFDFYASGASPKGNRVRYVWGWPPKPSGSWYYAFPPKTSHDYGEAVEDYSKPFLSHEIGQRCVYPDVINEPKKFTGYLQPMYLDIARDQLKQRGMLEQVPDFVRASGAWQIELYKEEFEANLRTPGLAGFQMLSLMDFPGQSTAPVGVLDYFYDQKGHITPKEFTRFCSQTVILARMDKRTFFTNEKFSADLELYNYAEKPFTAQAVWCKVYDSHGNEVFSQQLSGREFPIGNIPIDRIEFDLEDFSAPEKYTLVVSIGDQICNDWDFWVYPPETPKFPGDKVLITHVFDQATENALKAGRKVLLLPKREQLKGELPACFTSFYWTAFGLHGGESSAGGLLTDPNHPVFDAFPTDFHTNWQWWELLREASPIVLDDHGAKNPWPKSYQPLVQMVPSWKINRKLAVLAEAKVHNGKLMICSMDIQTDLENRKVARQFRYSLLSYMNSPAFNPETEISPAMVHGIFNQSGKNNLLQLGATISASISDKGHSAELAIDGDKRTRWRAPGGVDGQTSPFHFIIDMRQNIKVKGVSFMPGKENAGKVPYAIYVSEDGKSWGKAWSGKIENNEGVREILFDDDYMVRYIKFELSFKDQPFISVAEIDIIPANALPSEG